MHSRDYRDVIAGAVLVAFGLWFAWYALAHYGRGTVAKVGEGMFPAGLGILLAILGSIVAFSALLRQRAKSELSVRAPLFVLLGIAGFALLVKPFGMIPAIVALVVLSCLANTHEKKASPVAIFVMCGVLSLLCFLIFRVGLGLMFPLFDWPN